MSEFMAGLSVGEKGVVSNRCGGDVEENKLCGKPSHQSCRMSLDDSECQYAKADIDHQGNDLGC